MFKRFKSGFLKLRSTVSRALSRFPLPVVASIILTMTELIAFYTEPLSQSWLLFKVIILSIFTFLGFLSIDLYGERNGLHFSQKIPFYAGLTIFLIFYYFFLPFDETQVYQSVTIQAFLAGLGLFVLNFSLPTIKSNDEDFLKQTLSFIFLMALAACFSGILFLGTSLITGAVQYLFVPSLSWKVYATLACLSFGIFGTWFFLGSLPERLETVNFIYPPVWRFLAKFILIPLHTIYGLILYAYSLQIFILWKWPLGGVAYQIMGFAFAGIAILMFTYPIRNQKEHALVHFFGKHFFKILAPLLIVLFFAIGIRIAEFGITENRYFVVAIGVWLTGLCSFFIINHNRNLKAIPISLCILIFISAFGPWSAHSVSLANQLTRLKNLAQKNQMFVNGKITTPKVKLTPQDHKEFYSIFHYISSTHGLPQLQPLFMYVTPSSNEENAYTQENKLLQSIGLEPYYPYTYENSQTKYYRFNPPYDVRYNFYPVDGFDYVFTLETTINERNPRPIYYKNQEYKLWQSENKLVIRLLRNNSSVAQIDLAPIIQKLIDTYGESNDEIPVSELTINTDNPHAKLRIIFTRIEARLNKEINQFDNVYYSGFVFLEINDSD